MSLFTDENYAALASLPGPLLQWYDRSKRDMPWRGPSNSYYTWVSEIMLQQTRVEAVRAYFLRFIQALPTLADLAACGEEELLKLWEGLGYYNRVRNMQKAARVVMERYGGELPRDYEALLALPGIGEYTAGAIASIAYGIPVPCVDGNVLRVLSRVTANDADISSPAVKREYREAVQAVLPRRVGDFNQSLMELGAIVCLPNGTPLCDQCPVRELCAARREGDPLRYPVKAPKAARRVEERTVCVILCGGSLLLQKRPDTGLLAGLWEFWNLEGHLGREAMEQALRGAGLRPLALHRLKAAKHIFSHVEWRMQGWLAEVESPAPMPGGVWVPLEALREQYALPGAYKAYRNDLEKWVNR